VFQHRVTVFQHIATETVSADIYNFFFFFFVFSENKIKTFRNFILQNYNKERKWDNDAVSAAVTATVSAAVPASHVYS
jgi:hypothetical protein